MKAWLKQAWGWLASFNNRENSMTILSIRHSPADGRRWSAYKSGFDYKTACWVNVHLLLRAGQIHPSSSKINIAGGLVFGTRAETRCIKIKSGIDEQIDKPLFFITHSQSIRLVAVRCPPPQSVCRRPWVECLGAWSFGLFSRRWGLHLVVRGPTSWSKSKMAVLRSNESRLKVWM